MSVLNPERIVTKQDLKDFYDGILPYLGGNVEAGFTPIGTIIAVMGNAAPTNYLACNGQVVNIADYPELANYFLAQFGSRNKFGGNGTTTFGIPDLRGEFLRGTGTNSHTNQGNGSNVGTHQNATEFPFFGFDTTNQTLWTNRKTDNPNQSENRDSNISTTSGAQNMYFEHYGNFDGGAVVKYTSRPTNTSVLYCIATKNIYMNPALDYTTEEKVVGQWINGKPLYQKTYVGTAPSSVKTITQYPDFSIGVNSVPVFSNGLLRGLPMSTLQRSETPEVIWIAWIGGESKMLLVNVSREADLGQEFTYTVQYYKTTD